MPACPTALDNRQATTRRQIGDWQSASDQAAIAAAVRDCSGRQVTGTRLMTRAQSSSAVPAGKTVSSPKNEECTLLTVPASTRQALVSSASPSNLPGALVAEKPVEPVWKKCDASARSANNLLSSSD